MGDHCCVDGPTATLCVWKGATDIGPVLSPAAHPDRVRFHSSQENLGFIAAARTGSVDVTNWYLEPERRRASKKVTLFAHGLGYQPLMFGFLTIGGRNLPIQGSVLHQHALNMRHAYTVGADATHVHLNMLRLHKFTNVFAQIITYTLYLSVYGRNADGTIRRPPFFNGVDINGGASPSYVKAGRFSTEYRYPYRSASGPIPLARGRTISSGIGWTAPDVSAVGLGYRYSVDGHVVQRNATSIASNIAGAVGNNAAFNATVVKVAI